MKAYELGFDDIWEWIKDDDETDLKYIQAYFVFNFWENLAKARGKKEATFDGNLFLWWQETDDISGISPKQYHITGYVDLDGKKHYLYSDKRNYSNPF